MSLFHAALQPALDTNGNPISGATWNFYLTGTTTPQAVYSSSALSVSLGATVTANSAGRFAVIFLDDTVTYRAILKDAGGVTIKDIDPVNGSLASEVVSVTDPAFGAVGSGAVDDLAAIQEAHDYCLDNGKSLYFPAGTYKLSERLINQGVPFIGEGSALTFIRGAPGKDVIFFPDPSNASGYGYSRATTSWPEDWFLSGLTIQIDASLAAVDVGATDRPKYPVIGARGNSTAYSLNQYVTDASGAVLRCHVAGTTASSAPAFGTSPALIRDGTVIWEWIAPAQVYYGHAAIAQPLNNGNTAANVLGMRMRDVRVLQYNGAASANSTVGFYSQRAPYDFQGDGIEFRMTKGGLLWVPPTTNFAAQEYAPDEFDIKGFQSFSDDGFVVYNPLSGEFAGSCYSNGVSQGGFQLLQFQSLARNTASDVLISHLYVEGGTGAVTLAHLMGQGHSIGSCYVASNDADQRMVISGEGIDIAAGNILLSPNTLILHGDRNSGNIVVGSVSPINDVSGTNSFTISAFSGGATTRSERRIEAGTAREPAMRRTGNFASNGLGQVYFSDEDISWIGGREFTWNGTPALYNDPTAPSGGYARLTTGDYALAANNRTLDISNGFTLGRFPAARVQIFVVARSDAQPTIEVGKLPTYVAQVSVASGFTASWQLLELGEANLASFAGGALQINIPSLGAATYLEIAGLGFRVIPATARAASGVYVAGTKVVGTQGAAVADAAGGATVDAEARTALNALLARLRAHGVIAT